MKLNDVMGSDQELVKYLMVSHYFHVRNLLTKADYKGNVATIARISEGLLKYTTHIPVDR